RRVSRRWLERDDLRGLRRVRALVRERLAAGAAEAGELRLRWIEVIADQLATGLPYADWQADLREALAPGAIPPRVQTLLIAAAGRLANEADSAAVLHRHAEAELLLAAAVELRELAGDASPDVATDLRAFAQLRWAAGDAAGAEELTEKARQAVRRSRPGADGLDAAMTIDLADIAATRSDFGRAQERLAEAEELLRAAWGDAPGEPRRRRLRALYRKMAGELGRLWGAAGILSG